MEKKTVKKSTKTAKKKVENKTIKKVVSKRKSNTKKKKRKGFTLIELLAVIIILGVLMIIAIPAVTTYISNSRKSAYISSAKNLIGGARNIVNSGKLEMYDTSATYYIPVKYINSENETRSPYGAFTQAYVGVIYNGKGYNYYWISNDTARQGIKNVTDMNLLENDLIESNVNDLDIRTTVETTGIDGRTKILILGDNWKWEDERIASLNVTNDGFTEESDLKKSTFINGYDFNVKLKTLAGDNPTDYSTVDTNIKYIKYSATEPAASNKTAANLISTSGSEFPIYAWYSNGTIYWWSEDDKPNMNEISPYMFYNMRGLINIPEIGNMRTNNTVDMRYMFGNCINYEIIDVSSFVTRNVTDMRGMFYVNYQWNTTTIRSNVKEIRGLQNFNTSKVRNMNVMFHGQIKIKTLDLSSFDTGQVVDMSHMFGNCFALVNLNLSSFNTKNVQSMAAMFQHTTAIEVIDLSSFDTSNVVYMNHMFGCGGNNELCQLKEIRGLDKFNTSKVTAMQYMFVHQTSIRTVDLSSFDTRNVGSMNGMFYGTNITTIYASNKFDVTNLANSDYMFKKEMSYASGISSAYVLTGGAGTTYDPNHTNKEYARIDDPANGKPGYFTLKSN